MFNCTLPAIFRILENAFLEQLNFPELSFAEVIRLDVVFGTVHLSSSICHLGACYFYSSGTCQFHCINKTQGSVEKMV